MDIETLRIFVRVAQRGSFAVVARDCGTDPSSISRTIAGLDDALTTSAEPIGIIRLTASIAFGQKCIAPLLPELREAFPDLGIDLVLTDVNLDLVSEGVDLAVRLGPSRDSALIGVKLADTRYRVCA